MTAPLGDKEEELRAAAAQGHARAAEKASLHQQPTPFQQSVPHSRAVRYLQVAEDATRITANMVQATSTCCLVVGLTSVVLMLGICAAGADPTTTFVRVVAGAYIYGWLGFIGTSLGGAVVHGISGGIHGLKETIKEKAKKNTHDEQYGLPFAEARLKPAVRIEQDVSVAANAA